MQRRKKKKFDNLGLGFLVGFLLPLIIFFAVYYFNDHKGSFFDYINGLWRMQALVKLGSLCVFANVAFFWIFLKMKAEKAARGVLGATILYAMFVLLSRAF